MPALEAARGLTRLFDAELRYTSASPDDAIIPQEDRDGAYLGSGTGTVRGERVDGRIRWSFYAADCSYLLVLEGREVPPGKHLCRANPGGFIETADGATIRFDARGYGLRGFDPDRPHLWRLTMALQFRTEDERYAWLDGGLGVWEGEFDETTRTSVYRALLQSPRKEGGRA